MVSYVDPEYEDTSKRRHRRDARGQAEARRRRYERNASLGHSEAVSAAKEAAFGLLDRRARSVGELRQALENRGFAADAVDAVIARLGELGLVNDEVYARDLARSLSDTRGLVGQALALQLRRRLLGEETITRALADLDVDERASALRLAKKKVRSCRNVERRRALQRVGGFLARRGYPPSVAWEAAAQAWDAQEVDE